MLTLVCTRRDAVGWSDASFGGLVAAFPNSGFMGVPLVVFYKLVVHPAQVSLPPNDALHG